MNFINKNRHFITIVITAFILFISTLIFKEDFKRSVGTYLIYIIGYFVGVIQEYIKNKYEKG